MISIHKRIVVALALASGFLVMPLRTHSQTAQVQGPLARFPVAHEHGSGWCLGYLYIYSDSAAYDVTWPATDKGHSFNIRISDLQQTGRWMNSGQQLKAVEMTSGNATYHFWWLANEQDVINGRAYQFNPPDAGEPDLLIAAIRNPASLNPGATQIPSPAAMPQIQQPSTFPSPANPVTAPSSSANQVGIGSAESRFAVTHIHNASQCIGYLYVSPGRVRYEVVQPQTDKQHSVDLPQSEITAVQPWIFLGVPQNAVEIRTTHGNYHFWLLPDTADLLRTSPRQWGVRSALPVAPLIAALQGQPAPAMAGVPLMPAAPGLVPAFPAGATVAGVPATPTPAAAGTAYPGGPPPAFSAPPFATSGPAPAQSVPDLRYNPPSNFYKSATRNPEDYSSSQVNASMQVYPFRPFGGDIAQQFQRTLLREWIDPQYQEANIASRPSFSSVNLLGAQATLVVRFLENVAGTMKEHMRVVIVANGAAAVIDLSANSAMSWQAAAPTMLASLNSASVVQGSAATAERDVSLPGSPEASFAGLYMGSKQRYKATGFGPAGTGSFVAALHFYMLAPDGRLYRTYDPPPGDVRSFDYATAQRNDPENSGRWVRRGNQIVIQVGGPQPEQVVGAISAGGGFTVAGVLYGKQD